MIRALANLFRRDRNWRDRAFAPILSHTRATDGPVELELTPSMARAYDRDARSYASRRAHARAEARCLRAHRLEMEVAAMRRTTA